MEAVIGSETSVSIYHTTRCYIPEDSRVGDSMFLENYGFYPQVHTALQLEEQHTYFAVFRKM